MNAPCFTELPNLPRKWFFLLAVALAMPGIQLAGYRTNDCWAEFPALFNTEKQADKPVMSATVAAASIELPERFHASAFAAEPEVMNPIAMAWDGRGRLWVAENFTYAERSQRFQLDLRDRVLIFDNTSADHFATRRVFTDDIQMLTGLEIGYGGVWLMCPPRLLFLADKDQDDTPDGPATVVLDGFTVAQQNYHNFANGLRFGPDGWLYGRCGGSCPGKIGTPETPDSNRPALTGGVWRYHPLSKAVEVLNAGTTNPWGHDWNDVGEMFFCNTVNGHLWHTIAGAHHPRPFTLDPNRRTYEPIDFHADHWHFDTGKKWMESRDGSANDYGGGHAHSGTLVYQGGRWPKQYDGALFTLNFHGRRANRERIEADGSGYTIKHGSDFFLAADPWFRGIDLSTGPDGNVFVLDWSDTGECHEHTGVHRESGRIYKISYDPQQSESNVPSRKIAEVDFAAGKSNDLHDWPASELVLAHRASNRWYLRQARLELIRRTRLNVEHDDPQTMDAAIAELRKNLLVDKSNSPAVTVQSLLTLHACSKLDQDEVVRLMTTHPYPSVRRTAVRIATEAWPIDDVMGPSWKANFSATVNQDNSLDKLVETFANMARNESNASVRLALASTLQRLPIDRRKTLAIELVAHAEDAGDHNIPLMIWYGLIPLGSRDAGELVEIAGRCRIPTTLKWIARCVAEEMRRQPQAFDALLVEICNRSSIGEQETMMSGICDGLRGWKRADRPEAWNQIAALRAKPLERYVRELGVLFGDGRALQELKQTALGKNSESVSYESRLSALETLIQVGDDDLRAICESLLPDARMNVLAAEGLAKFDDPSIARQLIRRYFAFRSPDRPKIISLLVSRKSFANELLKAIQEEKIHRSDLSAFQARQIQSHHDQSLNRTLANVWGQVHDTPAARLEQIDKLKQALSTETIAASDKSNGRTLFNKHCSTCHRLYGEGATFGPDLSGANRSDLDYLLSNIVDPSGVVDKDYQMTVVLLDDGRIVNGLVVDQSDETMTLKTSTETIVIRTEEIEDQKRTNQSSMPEGLLETLSDQETQDLIGYLMHPSQVD
ncbi:PVC-type heme-binding CxxCH protein [Novipirellula aureliae]|nr:PVC-type heme-binding CxxCH protein [Novipirellula aureliae]